MTGHEKEFKDLVESWGWTALKNGWPDFLIFKDSHCMAIELKQGADRVSQEQGAMHAVLRGIGLPVYVLYYPDDITNLESCPCVSPEYTKDADGILQLIQQKQDELAAHLQELAQALSVATESIRGWKVLCEKLGIAPVEFSRLQKEVNLEP